MNNKLDYFKKHLNGKQFRTFWQSAKGQGATKQCVFFIDSGTFHLNFKKPISMSRNNNHSVQNYTSDELCSWIFV